MFKFEKLDVWQRALDYNDLMYELAAQLPPSERYNLSSQLTRAATSIALNIAEGSMGQTDAEQARFLSYALRSLIETVACLKLMERRGYLSDAAGLQQAYMQSQILARKLQALRNTLQPDHPWVREEAPAYPTAEGTRGPLYPCPAPLPIVHRPSSGERSEPPRPSSASAASPRPSSIVG